MKMLFVCAATVSHAWTGFLSSGHASGCPWGRPRSNCPALVVLWMMWPQEDMILCPPWDTVMSEILAENSWEMCVMGLSGASVTFFCLTVVMVLFQFFLVPVDWGGEGREILRVPSPSGHRVSDTPQGSPGPILGCRPFRTHPNTGRLSFIPEP